MNLNLIESRVYERLSFTASPDAVVFNRIRSYINSSYRSIMGKKQMAPYRRVILPFASTANSPYAVLPQVCTKIFAIQDRLNQRNIQEMSLQDLRDTDPGNDSESSAPDAYVILNFSAAVAIQPSNASDLFIKSTSAGDGATKEVFLDGVRTGGTRRLGSVVPNGVTAVSFGVSDWISIQKFYIALAAGGLTSASGDITLHEDSGVGTELARISQGDSYTRYTQIQLYPLPTVVVTYHADVEVQVRDLSEYTDEPLIPEDYHELLIEGALMRDYERREKSALYSQSKARYKELWGDLCLYTARMISNTSGSSRRWSQLGPYFPPGT